MMACLKESELMAYLEEAGTGVEGHLAGCARCRRAFDREMATRQRVNAWMAELTSPADEIRIDAPNALQNVLGRVEMTRVVAVLPVRTSWRSRYLAAAFHAAIFAVLMFGFTNPRVQEKVRESFTVFDPNLRPYVPKEIAGGGGGGAREPLPVTKGQAPKPALRQFTPPMIANQTPKLQMEPTIIAPPDEVAPNNNLPSWGDPLAKLINMSNGNGSGGGMGSGCCGGLGTGIGVGDGPGGKLGISGGIYTAGAGVTPPLVLTRVDPEYSDEARKAKFSGMVTLEVVVDTEGRVRGIRVVKSLGMGLDEKAIEAVSKWKFKPGMKSGRPVNVRALFEVSFRLL